MKRLLHEPLVHFLLLGAAIFVAFQWMDGRAPEGGRIVVTRGRIEALAAAFTRTWQRPPTAEELDGLIREHVREEAAVREAIALGLDQDDVIVRRRLRQKMEFIAVDDASAEPTEAQLRAWFEAHAADFRAEARLTFSHVYLDPQRRGEKLARDAEALLERLRRTSAGADVAGMGDPFLLGHRFERLSLADVRAQFAEEFASALARLEPRTWSGPIPSGFGTHLVVVHERVEGGAPTFEEVRADVHREWTHAQRAAAEERVYQKLLERYQVTIESPAGTPGEARAEGRP